MEALEICSLGGGGGEQLMTEHFFKKNVLQLMEFCVSGKKQKKSKQTNNVDYCMWHVSCVQRNVASRKKKKI